MEVPYASEAIGNELAERIRADIAFYGGAMPDHVAVCWSGYIAALLEWGLLTASLHRDFLALLPDIPNDPVVDILTGREAE